MLDFYFDDDPLEEMEQNHRQKLEQTLKIKQEEDEETYLLHLEELKEMETLIAEFKSSHSQKELEMEEEEGEE